MRAAELEGGRRTGLRVAEAPAAVPVELSALHDGARGGEAVSLPRRGRRPRGRAQLEVGQQERQRLPLLDEGGLFGGEAGAGGGRGEGQVATLAAVAAVAEKGYLRRDGKNTAS